MQAQQESGKAVETGDPWKKKPIEQVGETTVTGKNQVSLPAEGVRLLGWQRGDRLLVSVQRGAIGEVMVLMRRPDDWVEAFAGKLGHVFGAHEDILAYLEEERRSWESGEEGGHR